MDVSDTPDAWAKAGGDEETINPFAVSFLCGNGFILRMVQVPRVGEVGGRHETEEPRIWIFHGVVEIAADDDIVVVGLQ